MGHLLHTLAMTWQCPATTAFETKCPSKAATAACNKSDKESFCANFCRQVHPRVQALRLKHLTILPTSPSATTMTIGGIAVQAFLNHFRGMSKRAVVLIAAP